MNGEAGGGLVYTVKKQFQCDLCDKSYKHLSSLRTHRRLHTGERPYVCNMCDKSYTKNYYLTVHQRTHTDKRPNECGSLNRGRSIPVTNIPCLECFRSFSTKAELEEHRATQHATVRPFLCDICDRPFIHRSSLSRHRSVHQKERPYMCDRCEMTFVTNENLTIHQRTHTKGKPLNCDFCNFSCALKQDFEAHTMANSVNRLVNPIKQTFSDDDVTLGPLDEILDDIVNNVFSIEEPK